MAWRKLAGQEMHDALFDEAVNFPAAQSWHSRSLAGEHELAWLEKPNLTVLVQDVVESLVAQRLKDS